MTREIKFRAWDIRQKEIRPVVAIAWLGDNRVKVNAVNNPEDYMPLMNGYDAGDEFVLMQYTGLKDKNSVEIYEGDIVADVMGKRVPVIYDDARFAVDGGDDFIMGISQGITGAWEVIGNIWENPELLTPSNQQVGKQEVKE